jgi:hypothetical protein
MVWFIGVILALYGIGDLFAVKHERSLPWWGDMIAIALGALIVFVGRLLNDDD